MNHNTTYPNNSHMGYPAGGAATHAPADGYGPAPGHGSGHAATVGAPVNNPGQQHNSGLKHTLVGLHGAGDALRGSIGAAVDNALGHPESAARNRNVMERGIAEMRDGAWRGGAHAPVNGQEHQEFERTGRVGRHHTTAVSNRRETRRERNRRRRSASCSSCSSCSSCDEREKAGKPRAIHNSHLLNKLDPRVRPSDREAWANGVPTEVIKAGGHPNQTTPGHGNEAGLGTGLAAAGVAHDQYTHGGAAATTVPNALGHPTTASQQFSTEKHDHGSRFMNKMDPRVNADAAPSNIHRTNNGVPLNADPALHAGPNSGYAPGAAGYGHSAVAPQQQHYGAEPFAHGAASRRDDARVLEEQPVHGSKILNKLDPRVDSKLANTDRYAENTYPPQQGMDHPHSSNYGPHSTNIGNRMDPGVNSHPANYNNPQSENFGPHSTNMGNRVDPAVNYDPYNKTRY